MIVRCSTINLAVLLLFSLFLTSLSFAAISENHELVSGEFSHGSGSRTSENYDIQYDQIRLNIGGASTSPQYELQGGFFESVSLIPSTVTSDYYATVTSVNLTLTCPDPSGCTQMQFSNDNINWSTPEAFSNSKVWQLPSGEGSKTVYARFLDSSGNWTLVYPINVLLDTVFPFVEITPPNGLYTEPQLVTITSSELGNIYYSIDGSVPTITSTPYTDPFALASDATLNVLVVDPAGNQTTDLRDYTFCVNASGHYCSGRSSNFNLLFGDFNHGAGSGNSTNFQVTRGLISRQPVGEQNSDFFQIQSGIIDTSDPTPPSCEVSINAGASVTSNPAVDLSLICSHPTGCTQVEISNNGVGWEGPDQYSTSRASWPLTDNDGKRSVFVRFQSAAGVWSGVCSDSITLDTTPPNTAISPVGGIFMNPQSVALTASETAIIYYTIDGSDPQTSPTVVEYSTPVTIDQNNQILQAYAMDEAGNTGPVTSSDYEVCNGNNLSITGVITDSTTNTTMPLAIVTLNTGQTASTDINGNYSFTGLPRSYYTIESVTTASPGYVTYQDQLKLCQASVAHDIVLTKDATVFGSNTNSGYSADSVNTSTGNFVYRMPDLAIPGRGMSFNFERTYNSQDATNGLLGYGWTHNYNITLSEEAGSEVAVRWGDGKVEVWIPDGAGGYSPMPGVFSTLIDNGDNTFTLRQKDMIEYRFNTSNQLGWIVDEYGNTITFNYNGSELSSITDTVNRTISFTYDASSRITSILDPIGRSVTFSYDTNGDLVSCTNLENKSIYYTYDTNHQLLTVTDPMSHVVVTNIYDKDRRVVSSQRDALGGETLYTYDVATRTTKIIDPLGNISYHHFDELMRLVREEDALGNAAVYVYGAHGNLDSVTDKRGNVTSYVYDSSGNVETKTEPLGRVTSATYNADNNPVTKTDANGNVTTYTYDTFGNLETVTDALNNVTTYTYDSHGQMLTVTDAFSNITIYEYDIYGNQTAVNDSLGNRSEFTYDGVGRKKTETHPSSRSSAYEYDAMDRLISVTDALGNVSSFTFDYNGNKLEHIDAKGNKTLFTYDAKDRLVRKTTPIGEIENYTYDLLDRRIAVTNPNGVVTTVVYDPLGNVLQQIDAHGNTVRHEHDANGNKVKTVDALGNATTFVYDELNRFVSTTDAIGNTTTITYDLNGNLLTVTDALGKSTTSTYDALNRLVTVTDPLNNVTTNTYDALGRLATVRDAKGNQTSFEYDKLGRLIRVTDSANGTVIAQFDANGNRTSVTDTRNQTTTYTYDVLNRLISETDPLGKVSTMAYDELGNLLTLTDENTEQTSYTYDANNRLQQITYPDYTTVSYAYDANGNRLTVTDFMGVTTFNYNELDQVIGVSDPFGMTVGYAYNPNASRIAIKYPGKKNVYYTYDELNRLASVSDWGGVTTTYEYDLAGRLSRKTMGNGVTVDFSYDESGRLTSKADKDQTGAIIAAYTYTLDEVGNRTAMNMTQPLVPMIDVSDASYTHNDANQMLSANGVTYSYDNRGRRSSRDDGAAATQYAYNYDDMLVRVTKSPYNHKYKYNSDGMRLSSEINGVETRYLLDQIGDMEFILVEADNANTISRYHVYGDGLLYTIDADTGERHFMHYDPIGSTVAISDKDGNVTDSYAYLPYGELNRNLGNYENPFTYVGKFGVMQEPSGLYFMRARYYDPETKRFVSEDPVEGDMNESQSLNPYIYSSGNPILYTDPNGEIVITGTLLAVIAAKTIAGAAISYVTTEYLAPAVAEGACNLPGSKCTTIDKEKTSRVAGGMLTALNIAHSGWKAIKEAKTAWSIGLSLKSSVQPILQAGVEEAIGYGIESGVKTLVGMATLRDGGSGYSKVGGGSSSGGGPSAGISDGVILGSSNSTSPTFATPSKVRAPKKYLSVKSYASGYFKREFSKLLSPNFVDRQTRSVIERAIDWQVISLQSNRYGYRDSEDKKQMKEKRARDVSRSAKKLYSQLTSALSKYSVIVRDLSSLPKFSSGNMNRTGVYAK